MAAAAFTVIIILYNYYNYYYYYYLCLSSMSLDIIFIIIIIIIIVIYFYFYYYYYFVIIVISLGANLGAPGLISLISADIAHYCSNRPLLVLLTSRSSSLSTIGDIASYWRSSTDIAHHRCS